MEAYKIIAICHSKRIFLKAVIFGQGAPAMTPNGQRYVQLLLQLADGGTCFCTRGAMKDYAVITLFSRWQKP